MRGVPSYLFTYTDLDQLQVAYRHDDSDTTMDQIELRLGKSFLNVLKFNLQGARGIN